MIAPIYTHLMAEPDVWPQLHELADTQFGLFTADQAHHHGLSVDDLDRHTDAGHLFTTHGVYGFADQAANMHPFEDWAAQWLALQPAADINRRRRNPDSIISHDSAAVIRDLGTIVARGLHLTGPNLPPGPRLHRHDTPIGRYGHDWDIVHGLPVATPRRIVADLAADDLDGAHQGAVIADILDNELLTLADVAAILAPTARRWGAPDGDTLARRFLHAADRPAPPI